MPIFAHVLIKAAEENQAGDWIVSGPVASLKEDYDGDIMEKSGIMKGLEMFKRLGSVIDYAHMYASTHDPDYLIGKGLEIKEVDGVPWISVQLYKAKKLAQKVWNHLQAGGEMGFSIEGIAKARDARNKKRITETEIHRITIDPMPKGFEDARQLRIGHIPDAMQLAKALVSGEVEANDDMDMMDEHEPIEKASVPHAHTHCNKCGGKLYCIHCHRNAAGRSNSSTTEGAAKMKKGVNTDESDFPQHKVLADQAVAQFGLHAHPEEDAYGDSRSGGWMDRQGRTIGGPAASAAIARALFAGSQHPDRDMLKAGFLHHEITDYGDAVHGKMRMAHPLSNAQAAAIQQAGSHLWDDYTEHGGRPMETELVHPQTGEHLMSLDAGGSDGVPLEHLSAQTTPDHHTMVRNLLALTQPSGSSTPGREFVKGMETGEGVVAAGSTDSAAPLRKQELKKKPAAAGADEDCDCEECGTKKKDGKCPKCVEKGGFVPETMEACPPGQAMLEKSLRAQGVEHPALLARILPKR